MARRFIEKLIKAGVPNKNGDVFPHDVLAKFGLRRRKAIPAKGYVKLGKFWFHDILEIESATSFIIGKRKFWMSVGEEIKRWFKWLRGGNYNAK